MSNNNSYNYGRFKKTLLAASIMAIGSAAYAADDSKTTGAKDDDIEEIVVSGIRRNIESAQELKRNANTVIDSITADELGDFPDKSVAEALMRVPGVMIERFATRTDTGAFSVEPSGVIIRGLPFVRSEFNGRDTFSADSSRGLSWGDVSPELMGGVDIYKNQTAELIEGGISGLVNLKTRLPFDSDSSVNVVTLGANYSDLSKSSTPELSGIHTSRFDTDVGEFGVMANFAYSDVDATSQSSRMARVNRFRDVYAEDSLYFIPQGVSFGDSQYSRERNGAALAFQWQDNEGRYLATLQYNRSQYENTSEGRGIGVGWAGLGGGDSLFLEIKEGGTGSGAIIRPAPGTDAFTFAEDGLFSHGTVVQNHGWWGANNNDSKLVAANANGEALVETCASLDSWAGCGEGAVVTDFIGGNLSTNADVSDSKSVTEDISLNFKWNVTDKFRANFDVQHVNSDLDEYRVNTGFNTWANPEVDLRHDLNRVVLNAPTNVNLLDAGQGIFANPNSYYPTSVLEFLGDNNGEEFATKVDLIYDVDSGFVERIKTGVRYADRDQQVNQAGNWQAMSTSWNQNAGWFNIDSPAHTGIYDGEEYTFNGYKDAFVVDTWKSNYGSISIADGGNFFVFPNTSTMRDWKYTNSAMATGQPVNGFYPICSNLGGRLTEVEGTCFRPNESLNVSEETEAFYVQIDFGGNDLTLFDRPVSGNIGARYVKTEIASAGGEQFPEYDLESRPCEETTPTDPDAPETRPPVPFTVTCYLGADEIAFMNNGGNLGTSKATHHNVLPSFNIKYDVTDNFVTRFALSRAMSRPDIGSLRNYITVSSNLPSVDDETGSLWVKDASGEIVGANVAYTASAANPYLKPTIADQADISFEYYSGPNSISLALYKKSFDDYIQTGTYFRKMTNNGVTKDVVVTGPINGDGAEVQGFEVQGTHLFHYLPGFWSGFGIQANYTYVENKGIENTGVNSSSENGSSGSSGASDRVQVDQLEGMSKDAYNLGVFYERNKFSARLSYNWRAEYLVTVQDCCIGTPVWQDDYGQLDASLRYRINDMFELSLSGSNLTDQKAVLTQQMENSEDGGKRLKYSINQSDIRYTLGLRAQF
ncbi:TonB-dependent receptor [Cellvibrio sp. QJXJ]|uniref:TonB-dependent receptor n=1 Tax=Cellvibrio sp. QJXJ TaxID=2964606 RepID=UPI0021C3197C|nr:TonB-dependent receptor [Cellvibrio sp. QJXJ]UUA73589.1 TonB-dependent receptor [Cellvibrio sp. QJXJ]